MFLQKAMTLAIADQMKPVMNRYDLGCLIDQLYRDKAYRGETIERLQKKNADISSFDTTMTNLEDAGVLETGKLVDNVNVYRTLSREHASEADIACCIDPFAYVSHLSAMEWHGLTDRLPKILFLSSPPPAEWARHAKNRMRRDIGEDRLVDYLQAGLPTLKRYRFTRIRRTTVHRHASAHLGAYITVKGTPLRVATLGRTFLDMLRAPDLCGGIYHVLDIFENRAADNLDLIVAEFDTHGRKIDRVRAGYILEERLGLSHPAFDRWLTDVQRGGSRRLDPTADYAPRYSERWCLSINVEG
ncbi:type IV toxin-antitoxin system AbiEi family antitoxin domain-containing protein [Rhodospira trueperi]|uniref:Transcriptional regulator, AbiEi antitoxin, Type IV TA system n=1 Tax=Rhodospira trueperi TaxID=69960 RepID=A0A1G7DVT6_9PROT|nr:hypothetical protein [Rhodospira trueperi]SDE55502.1 hypothetical protein SAMN05421720_10849 [Rhodospira trueperi]